MNCSPSGSSVLGIFWARMLEWIAIYFSSRFVGLTIKFRWIFSCLEGQHPQQLNCSRVNCIMNNHKLILHKIDHILSFLRASLVAQIVKHLPAMGSIPGLGRSPGEENGNSLQYSCLNYFFEKKLFILFNFIPECLHKMTFSFIATTVLSYLMKVKIQSFNIQLIFTFP